MEKVIQPGLNADCDGKVSAYSWYIGWTLLLVSVISMLDRKALVMLAEPIKRDLQLSDTQLGLLTGGLFTLVHAVATFPLARLADRYSRAKIIGVCMVIWSALTALGGLATGFLTLAGSRIGVAMGEAGATPASHALLADRFPPSARGRAYGILLAGGPIGILLGLGLGGWLNDLFDWRGALVVLGLPGVAVGFLILLTIRDAKSPEKVAQQSQESFIGALRSAISTIVRNGQTRNILIGAVFLFLTHGALNALFPAYVMRNFQLSATSVGLALGITIGAAGFIGSLSSGWLTDWLALRDKGAPTRVFSICLVIIAPLSVTRMLVGNFELLLGFVALEVFLTGLFAGPTFSTLQATLSDRQRALGTAIFVFGISGIGASLGPLAVGMISDLVANGADATAESLRIGFLCVAPFPLVAAWFYARAARSMIAQRD